MPALLIRLLSSITANLLPVVIELQPAFCVVFPKQDHLSRIVGVTAASSSVCLCARSWLSHKYTSDHDLLNTGFCWENSDINGKNLERMHWGHHIRERYDANPEGESGFETANPRHTH